MLTSSNEQFYDKACPVSHFVISSEYPQTFMCHSNQTEERLVLELDSQGIQVV